MNEPLTVAHLVSAILGWSAGTLIGFLGVMAWLERPWRPWLRRWREKRARRK